MFSNTKSTLSNKNKAKTSTILEKAHGPLIVDGMIWYEKNKNETRENVKFAYDKKMNVEFPIHWEGGGRCDAAKGTKC